MQIFAIFEVTAPIPVGEKIAQQYPENYLKVGGSSWLIASSGQTTKDVCDKIGIGAGGSSGIVTLVSTYWGWTAKNVWEWIAAKEKANG